MTYFYVEISPPHKVVGNTTTVARTSADVAITELLVNTPFERPTASVVLSALDWRRRLYAVGFADISVFPGYDGEILLSAIRGDFCFEVTVETDNSFSVSFERKGQDVFYVGHAGLGMARDKLIEATRLIWILSVGFTRAISTLGLIGSPASHLRTSKAAYPS